MCCDIFIFDYIYTCFPMTLTLVGHFFWWSMPKVYIWAKSSRSSFQGFFFPPPEVLKNMRETTRNLGNGKDKGPEWGVDCVNFMSCQITVLLCVICGGLPES